MEQKNIKELTEKYNKLSDKIHELKELYRKAIIELISTIVNKYGGSITFADDDDFVAEMDMSISRPNVSYDGGNHPEYASSCFSEVYGVKVEKEDIYLEIEDSEDYSIERVWASDELESVVDALVLYDEFKEKNK